MKKIILDGVEYALVPVEQIATEEIELSITHFKGMVAESDKYCFEATKIKDDDVPGRYYDGCDIKFTDKRVKPWKEDNWDSEIWMRAILENDVDAIKSAREIMCPRGVNEFRAFLKVLTESNYL